MELKETLCDQPALYDQTLPAIAARYIEYLATANQLNRKTETLSFRLFISPIRSSSFLIQTHPFQDISNLVTYEAIVKNI